MQIDDSALERCQDILGYRFNDVDLLVQSLTHASVADDRLESNERLEFLGDAILGMIVCSELYRRFPEYLEGELTKIKSNVVSRHICAQIASRIGLSDLLLVGKGMATQGRIPRSCCAAVFEAVIGAIYLDGGEQAAWGFVSQFVGPLLDCADAEEHQDNFKSMLQQHAQRTMDTTPIYEILDEKGPDHSKCFEVGVVVGPRRFATAWGPSKKQAEQLAAFKALRELGVIDEECPPPTVAAS